MNMSRNIRRRAFTLVELIAVIVVLAILSGVAIPKYFDYAARARTAATEGAIGGVRAGLSNFYADQAISGTAAYPTSTQLTTLGTVMQESIPRNPYNNLNTVGAPADLAAAQNRTVSGNFGWMYFVDNSSSPPVAIFYANSTDATTAPDGSGGTMAANDL